MTSRVLIVEDEADIRDLLAFHLEREGYQVSKSRTGADALRQVKASPPDLILLDIMLPELDGLEVCRRLRREPATAALPIVMLTAKGDEVDRVLGLELGADDYIVKPFSPNEVVARVRAVLRRARPPSGAERIVTGQLSIDSGRHVASVGERPVQLTPKEFDLLRALAEAEGRMAEKAQRMVKESLDAFVARDTELARRVCAADGEVDALKEQIFRELLTFMMEDARTIPRAIRLILISRFLERVADHATNIAEMVVYMVEGKMVRHTLA